MESDERSPTAHPEPADAPPEPFPVTGRSDGTPAGAVRRRRRGWLPIALVVTVLFGVMVAIGIAMLLIVIVWGDFGDRASTGAHSRRLPITVEPATGLTDGALVRVRSTAFEPGAVVGVSHCLPEADTESRGVEACDTVHGSRFSVPPDGRLDVSFSARRFIVVDGVIHDCHAVSTGCLVVAAVARDLDESGGVPVWFGDDDSVPPAPTAGRRLSLRLPISIDPDEPLDADAEVTVTATGFQPGEPIVTAVCGPSIAGIGVHDAGDAHRIFGDACEAPDGAAALLAMFFGEPESVELRADADGTVTVAMRAMTRLEPVLGDPASEPGSNGDDGGAPEPIRCGDRKNPCAFVIAAAADLQRSAIAPYTVER